MEWREFFPRNEFRKYQASTINMIIKAFESGKKYVIVEGPTGCHAKGTDILMFDKTSKKVEDIEIGDLLMGPDRRPRTVIKLHRGRQEMVKIIPTRGKPFVVNLDHILSVKLEGRYCGPKSITVRNWLNSSEHFKDSYKLYRKHYVTGRVTRLSFTTENLPEDDYFGFELTGEGDTPFYGDRHLYLLPDSVVCHNSGKSLLAITVGLAFGDTYLATPQKMLQDQYSADFPDLLCELKGRGTYPCLRTNFNRNKKNKGEEYSPVELRSGLDYIAARDPLNLTDEERSLVQYSCSNAPCNRGSKKKKKDMQTECADFCVYLNQRSKAFAHSLTLMNFSNLLLFTTLMDKDIDWLQPRSLLILDEAHLIEDHLYDWASFVISTHAMKGLEMYFTSAQDFMRADLPFDSVKELCEYVGNHIIPSYEHYALARPKGADDSDEFDLATETNSERHRRLRAMYEKLCYFLDPVKEANKPKPDEDDRDENEIPPSGPLCKPTDKTHVLIPKTRLEGKDEVPSGTQVVPFDVSSLGPSLGFKSSYDKVLLMSATILDVDTYTKSLGIKPEEAVFIRVPSTFPPENRPIIGMPVGYMSYEKIKLTLPKVMEKTVELLEKHSDQKGLIHTGNFVVCRALEKYIKEHGSLELLSRCKFAIAGDAKQKAAIIREHTLSKEPSVLIGPGFLEGLDLKDDLARFQIVMKMPFPSLGNPLVKRKAEEFPAWYQLRTALSFIQLVGRPVRSSTDWAVTYVLDSCWRMFWERAKKIFPDYLHKSISWIRVF